jgi:hypothetical protein
LTSSGGGGRRDITQVCRRSRTSGRRQRTSKVGSAVVTTTSWTRAGESETRGSQLDWSVCGVWKRVVTDESMWRTLRAWLMEFLWCWEWWEGLGVVWIYGYRVSKPLSGNGLGRHER